MNEENLANEIDLDEELNADGIDEAVNDVPENAVVAGAPAKVIKMKDEKTISKTEILDALRGK